MKINTKIQVDSYPNNNTHILKITFSNDEKIQLYLQSCYISIPDLNIYNHFIEIKKVLRKSNWFFNPQVKISIPLKLTQKIVFRYNFVIDILVNRLEKEKYGPPCSFLSQSYFQFTPTPVYRAFISRSVRDSEKNAPDIISQYIQYWGFSPYTVGIHPLNKQFSDEELLVEINNQIQMADVVFGIATRRDKLADNLHWKTFEWLQGETGMAYAKKKQILIFVEKGIDLSGPAAKCNSIEFDLLNLKKIAFFLDKIMPTIRENIESRLNTEALYKILLLGSVFVVGGFAIKGLKESINEIQEKAE